MAVQVWYRGFALGVQPAGKDTGGMHDVGDGIYFTADAQAARDYARLRGSSADSRGTMVFQVEIDMSRFRVLDLVGDPRWQKYLHSELLPGRNAVGYMQMSSENYGRFFKKFCDLHKISLNQYDMVVAEDLQSGGTRRRTVQMSLLYKNGGYTTVHGEVLSKMQPAEKNGVPVRTVVDPTRVVGGPRTTSGAQVIRSALPAGTGQDPGKSAQTVKLERASQDNQSRTARIVDASARNAEAANVRWMGYSMAVSKAAFHLNNASLEQRVKDELIKRKPEITRAFDNRQGVLIIVHVAVEKHSEAGFCAKSFENLWLQPGSTADEALTRWRQAPRLFAALPANAPYRFVEEYRWLEGGSDI